VVGASGGIFGLFGLLMADLMVNYDTISQPILRSLATLGFLGFFLYTAFTEVRAVWAARPPVCDVVECKQLCAVFLRVLQRHCRQTRF
jgi:hypothetical protein